MNTTTIDIPASIPDELCDEYVAQCMSALKLVINHFDAFPNEAEVEMICNAIAEHLLMPSHASH